MHELRNDPRFAGIEPFEKKIWLASPTMHGEELHWISEAIRSNWVTTLGENIDAVEQEVCALTGVKYAVALSSGTASLHLAIKLAGEKLFGRARPSEGTLAGQKVFCSDMTFDATVNPIAYEDGEAVFIDTEPGTWNMCPDALRRAFEQYPGVRLVVMAHVYGTPARMQEIKDICARHDALIVEDAAESLGAQCLLDGKWVETGAAGDFGCISFNGNKIITGSSGGMFLTGSKEDADKVRKWSTQSREAASWYQHEEVGYNYRMSNLIAGTVRGQLPYLKEHIARKKAIWERYEKGFEGLPVKMNPWDRQNSRPNFWLSCMTVNEEAMAPNVRGDREYLYRSEKGKSSPDEILDALRAFNAEGRPIWKPMHLQPIYRMNAFVTAHGNGRGQTNAYIEGENFDVGEDIFRRGLCLPSDNKMTIEEQDRIIQIIRRCFE